VERDRDTALDAARKVAGVKVSQARAELEAELPKPGTIQAPLGIGASGGTRGAAAGRRGFR